MTPTQKSVRSSSPAPRLALSKTEAAAALGVSLDFLTEHVAPELRWTFVGRKQLVSIRELERWLERSATGLANR